MAEIRNVEFHFHLEKDSTKNPTLIPFPPSIDDFGECPIWYFVDEQGRIQAPNLTILLTCDGTGSLPRDYDAMLGLLEGLMNDLVTARFEHVEVKLEFGSFVSANERRALKHRFEKVMGTATVIDGNVRYHMEFCPSQFMAELDEERYPAEHYIQWI